MKNFKYAPEVKIGTEFVRIDRNGNKWIAKVINRTEYFVDIEKTTPYKIKVQDDGNDVALNCWHYEEAPKTYERAEIHENYDEVETGNYTETIWGKVPEKKKVKLQYYTICLKENYDRYCGKYDKIYKFDFNECTSSVQEGIDLFHKYCEEN